MKGLQGESCQGVCERKVTVYSTFVLNGSATEPHAFNARPDEITTTRLSAHSVRAFLSSDLTDINIEYGHYTGRTTTASTSNPVS